MKDGKVFLLLLIGKGFKMRGVYFKKIITITFGLFVFLFFFVIEEKIGAKSEYASTIEKSYIEKAVQVFGTEDPQYQNESIETIERQINSFFSYLDEQQYIKSYKSFNNSKKQFQEISKVLVKNQPMIPRETDSLHKVLQNVFYFYRVLGKERVRLIKDILENESDIIEPIMRAFYLWLSAEKIKTELNSPHPSIEQLYVYACFFLETLGGRNYLFRRSPKIRILTSYYCVLIIDQANNDGVNSNGVDIRPHIKHVLREITPHAGLDYKSRYIAVLEKLMKKYFN